LFKPIRSVFPAMEIPSLATCQRTKYENELLRKKVMKLRGEKEEMRFKLEIAERKARIDDLEKFAKEPSSTMNDAQRCNLPPTRRKPWTEQMFSKRDASAKELGKTDFSSDSIGSDGLNALGIGREPKPNKIITEEGERLHGLINMQNKVIQRYEIQLKELKNENANCDRVKKENEALKLENSFLNRELENAKRAHSEIKESAGEERIQLLVREISKLKQDKDELIDERARLNAELSSLDPEFFEEIEDLKFSLIQSRKLNVEYEKTIAVLSDKLGLSPPLSRKNTAKST